MKNFLKRLAAVISLSLLIFSAGIPIVSAEAFDPDYSEDNDVAAADEGMVVSAHPLASETGYDILANGGNAMDAAIAMQYVLTVAEPMMSGIGGGGFMMVYDGETGETSVINSRERAPAGADTEMFLDEDGEALPFEERVRSGKSVGVPGTLRGLEAAHETWGTVDMSALIAPAISIAEEGFMIDDFLSAQISDNAEKLQATAAAEVFFNDAEPLAEGDVLVQEDLAKTLNLIKDNGIDYFYNSEISKAAADAVQEFGGSMTPEDLSNYEITLDEPIWGEFNGYDIATMPPPSSGGIFMLQMLGMLDGFDLSQYDINSPEKYHLMAEAMHLAYADRAEYAGDPEFVHVPAEGLLHPDYIAERSTLISMDSVNEEPEAGDPWEYQTGTDEVNNVAQPNDKVDGQTTHFSVADKYGNVVSYTTTIEQVFGSGIMVPEYGFMLNNELTDFDAEPGGANEVQPNKRPLSSMTPTIVFDNGKPVMTAGSPGGQTIITSVLQTIINAYEYELDVHSAVTEPRIFTNDLGSYRFEEGIPEEVISQLNEMGHNFEDESEAIGNVSSIQIDPVTGEFTGATDKNRNGAAYGLQSQQ